MSGNNTPNAIDANEELKRNIINNLKDKGANKKKSQSAESGNKHQKNNKPTAMKNNNKPRPSAHPAAAKNNAAAAKNTPNITARNGENKVGRKNERSENRSRGKAANTAIRRERPANKNKFDRLDKDIINKYNQFNRSGVTRAEDIAAKPLVEEEEIIPVDYAAFLKSEREKTNEGEETYEIVGVRFKPVGKIYFFSPENQTFSPSDKVITQTTRGIEMGEIVFGNRLVSENKVFPPLKPIIRRATEDDIKRIERNRKAAKEAIKIAEECVKSHNLKMKFIDADYMFDNSKLTYYFTHEGRVDFRDLVKDLAAVFKIRIQLHQIATRDQTKVIGGLSVCGRPFCCSSFLPEFESVTIKMVKDQNLSINSAKISGACGKLMCCLKYEHETYEHLNKDLPRTGAFVETADNERGVVIECNAITGICRVRITRAPNQRSDGENIIRSYSKEQLKITGYQKREQGSSHSISTDSADSDATAGIAAVVEM